MSLQGGDLAAEGVRDVHNVGHLRMGHDPDLVDMPRLEPLPFDELGPGVTVLGSGIDGTDGGFAGCEVIRMGGLYPVVPSLRRLDQDALGLNVADDLDDLALQLPRGLKPTVSMPWQEPHVLDAERGGRGDLFPFADGRHLLAVAVVEPALLAVRAQQDRDAQPGVDPTGDGPGRPEVTVVRMRHHHEDALDLLVGSWRGGLAEGPLRHVLSLVRSRSVQGRRGAGLMSQSEFKEVVSASEPRAVSYTHLRAHETDSYLVCRLLLEKK